MGALGVALPELKLLEAAVARLEGFQAQARDAISGRPTRQQLADLQQVSLHRPNSTASRLPEMSLPGVHLPHAGHQMRRYDVRV